MNTIEIHFSPSGNTVIGSYSKYLKLLSAIEAKSVFLPNGHCIKGSLTDLARLVEYVCVFGHCIKSMNGWLKACELAGMEVA
jgi:hypothetical protein